MSYLNQAVVWTTTHSILIPYGKGQRWGRECLTRLPKRYSGGWTFDGLTTLQSGLSFAYIVNEWDSSNSQRRFCTTSEPDMWVFPFIQGTRVEING